MEDFKVQISIRDDESGALYNFRGDSVSEVSELIAAAARFAAFSPALALLERGIQRAAQGALGTEAAAEGSGTEAPKAEAATSGDKPRTVRYRNPDAPRTEAQARLITRLGGKDDPNLTVSEAGRLIDELMAKRPKK